MPPANPSHPLGSGRRATARRSPAKRETAWGAPPVPRPTPHPAIPSRPNTQSPGASRGIDESHRPSRGGPTTPKHPLGSGRRATARRSPAKRETAWIGSAPRHPEPPPPPRRPLGSGRRATARRSPAKRETAWRAPQAESRGPRQPEPPQHAIPRHQPGDRRAPQAESRGAPNPSRPLGSGRTATTRRSPAKRETAWGAPPVPRTAGDSVDRTARRTLAIGEAVPKELETDLPPAGPRGAEGI